MIGLVCSGHCTASTHAADESILCRDRWQRGSSQMTLERLLPSWQQMHCTSARAAWAGEQCVTLTADEYKQSSVHAHVLIQIALPVGQLVPHLIHAWIMVPLANMSQHPKRHLNRFNRFCAAQGCAQQTDRYCGFSGETIKFCPYQTVLPGLT